MSVGEGQLQLKNGSTVSLLDLFRRKEKPPVQPGKSNSKTVFKAELDTIEKQVFEKFKTLGFKKNGRTFNRRLDDGIVQVINFQSGLYPIGENHVILGLRENLYGKFAVNLGICIESLYKFQSPVENKKYYKEYECQIRHRLGSLMTGQEYWWTITNDNKKITEEIIVGLENKGLDWFSGVETKEKIISNYGNPPYNTSPRAKLDIALIVWFDDKEKGSELFREYYHKVQPESPHKGYVGELAKELKIKL